MLNEETFAAPWNRVLKLMTIFCVIICAGVFSIGIVSLRHAPAFAKVSAIFIPLLILLGGAIFMVRGYTLSNGRLIIRRLGWSSVVDLTSLISATPDPSAMDRSIRLMGNGGLFAFTGLFRNRKLENFRVFGTDPRRSVVLRFPNKTVVVTPDNPEKFAAEIAKAK